MIWLEDKKLTLLDVYDVTLGYRVPNSWLQIPYVEGPELPILCEVERVAWSKKKNQYRIEARHPETEAKLFIYVEGNDKLFCNRRPCEIGLYQGIKALESILPIDCVGLDPQYVGNELYNQSILPIDCVGLDPQYVGNELYNQTWELYDLYCDEFDKQEKLRNDIV